MGKNVQEKKNVEKRGQKVFMRKKIVTKRG
jgi:hypothetical protein